MDPYAKKIKELAKKRTRTEPEEFKLRELEARGGMYTHKNKVTMPAENVKAMLADAGKQFRQGSTVKKAVNMTTEFLKLTFEGPTDPDVRAADVEYRDERIVSLNPQTKTKGVRTRPIFREWKVSGTLRFNEAVISKDELKAIFEAAGISGFCERHAGFGQFELTKFS